MLRNAGAPPRYLTIPEAAARLGVSPDTIRRRIESGALPAWKFARKWRLLESDVLDLVRREPGDLPDAA